jgi:hypothetical protein
MLALGLAEVLLEHGGSNGHQLEVECEVLATGKASGG